VSGYSHIGVSKPAHLDGDREVLEVVVCPHDECGRTLVSERDSIPSASDSPPSAVTLTWE